MATTADAHGDAPDHGNLTPGLRAWPEVFSPVHPPDAGAPSVDLQERVRRLLPGVMRSPEVQADLAEALRRRGGGAGAPTETSPPLHVAWLDLGDGAGWVRAFETREPGSPECFRRMVREAWKAGATASRLLPEDQHPAGPSPEMPEGPRRPGYLVWEAGRDGGPPTLTRRRLAGWVKVAGAWRQVCSGDDAGRCLETTLAEFRELDAEAMRVLPEGRPPE